MYERDHMGGPSPIRCWCGEASTELDLVMVEAGPRVIVRGWCREHAQVDAPALELRPAMAPASDEAAVAATPFGAVPRWTDLDTAASTIALAVASLPIPILVLDPEGEAVAANQAWSEVTGLSISASLGRRWLIAVTGASDSLLSQIVSTARPSQLFVGLQRFAHPYLSGLLSARPLDGPGDAVVGHIVFFTGLTGVEAPPGAAGWTTENEGLDQARAEAAWTELLRRVDDVLDRHRGQSTTMAALMVDVDEVVDGPDEILEPVVDPRPLRVAAQRIGHAARAPDSVLSIGARFAVICESVLGYEEVARLAQRLIDAVSAPIEVDAHQWRLRASVGVAFPHLPADTAEALVSRVERATQLARTLGGQRFEVVIGTGPGSSDSSQVVATTFADER
jgi:GGDEF domain-containing protein